jgi:small subunit ribosomal protein S11
MAEEKEIKAEEQAPAEKPVETAEVKAAPAAEASAEAAAVDSGKEETASDIMADPVAAAPATQQRRSRHGKHIPVGVAHIKATFNNTLVSITDPRGAVIAWSSAGRAGFKGSRKSTAFAATLVAQEAARTAVTKGMHEVEVQVQGAGAGRESAIRGIQSAGMSVSVIKDVTPIAHNGCRARKRRRV